MRVMAVMIRILRQFKHDKRTVALMFFAPIFVLTLNSFIFSGSDYHPKLAVINSPLNVVNKLENDDVKIIRLSEYEAMKMLEESKIDGILNYKSGEPHISLEGSDPTKNMTIVNLVKTATRQMNPQQELEISYLYGYDDMSSFDNFGPILIGFFVFFFVFLISGVSFLGERTTGTLERLLATPLRRWEVVLGYVLGFGIVTAVQSALIAWYSIYVLDIMMVGSFFYVLVITILTAMVALTIGTTVSAFANNELQMIQFVQIIVIPQVFFSGLFDLSTFPPWLQYFGRLMPLWYSADALKNVMIRGKGWSDIAFDAIVLILICLIFVVANIITLKKYRKI